MTQADMQLITGKSVVLGEGMGIVRTVPTIQRRQIGAWCFLDHFGPVDVGTPDSGRQGMRVGPHPHIGLQTVTW
ncbi:pirin family protein, partial [Acinetobacter baumannii]